MLIDSLLKPKQPIMKKLSLLLFWSLILALLLSSCNKDVDQGPTNSNPEIQVNPPIEMITASVFGQVIDEDGNPIAAATVIINNTEYTTDSQGLYSATDISINGYGNLVTISKSGYFSGAKLIQTEDGRKANLNVTLITKTMKGSIMSTDGGIVTIDGESTVDLPAGGIKDSNGEIYTGEVNVYAKWLDPSSLSTLDEMPGDLRAVNSNSDIMQLATYGMLAVELESPSGQSLNLSDGNTAELTFDLPTSMVDAAPATLPLWYFDETTGYWIEEGVATLVNGTYVGEVSHFSFWNCDAPFPLVNASGTIVNTDGEGLDNILVEIQMVNGLSCGYAYTDNRGFYSGKIPQDEVLIINVYNQCNQVVYTSNIGPFSADVIIQPIIIDESENLITISGTLLDCDGNAVSDGYVAINFNGLSEYLSTESDGTFQSTIDICNDAGVITATGYNFEDLQQSNPSQYTIDGQSSIDVGTLTTCDDLESYFYYQIEGVVYTMETAFAQTAADSISGTDTYIYLSGNTPSIPFTTIGVNNTMGPGTYNPEYTIFFTASNLTATCTDNCPDFTITFQELGYDSGASVKATFSGTMESDNGTTVEVSGGFKGEIN